MDCEGPYGAGGYDTCDSFIFSRYETELKNQLYTGSPKGGRGAPEVEEESMVKKLPRSLASLGKGSMAPFIFINFVSRGTIGVATRSPAFVPAESW